MDESLSDFQVKKNIVNAKNTQKTLQPSTSKAKPKKNIKKIRGQRDIRTVIKKKNELISYYNDFDKICKQSGIDVDSEQLQLAIALSKSLQETETKVEEKEESLKPLTAKEISGKIRTTLQEYGFVVPEVKITTKKTRKVKRYRKNYKLLQTTEAEKQQVISDKYSQVLFQNLDDNKEIDCSDNKNESTAQLYHLGTNISYEKFKDNNLLYVEDLLEKSPSFVGCLLKDWAKIPGRPVSPTTEPSRTEFDKINCTQEELDVVLSGLIKAAQEIVKNKHILEEPVVSTSKSKNCTEEIERFKMDTDCIEILEKVDTDKLAKGCIKDKFEAIDVENFHQLTVTQKVRSCSPDIFDDEVSQILNNSNQSMYLISDEPPMVDKTKHCAQIMDLTECININSQTSVINSIPPLPLSQGNQTIKRKSNDFMDITECVVGSSQAIRENVIIEENVDLTQNSDEDNVTITECTTKTPYIQRMDLTQSSDTNEELPEVQISGNKSLDETIILNEDDYSSQLNKENVVLQNKNNESDSSFKKLKPTSNCSSQDRASITLDSEDEIDSHTSLKETPVGRAISPIEHFANHHNLESGQIDKSTEAFNMTENHFKSRKISEDTLTKTKTESFFEEFEHRHSESSCSKDMINDILCVDESSAEATNNSISNENNSMDKHDDIDLTQDTDTSEEVAEPIKNSPSSKTLYDSDKLGKIGNVSIDYDELFDDIARGHNSPSKSISSRSHATDFNSESHLEKPSTSDLVSHSSQNSEAFEISDKELDYSINKSRLLDNPKHNFDFGGISLVDNLPDLPSFRPSTNNYENRSFNRSLSETHLPAVEVKGSIEKQNKSKSNSASPCKLSREEIIAKTPKNGEYIVKTNNVTPMIDYEKMSTPEMNAELDKYGLRPFKRKRAIQLLTHLYNQTHPVIESLEIDPSGSPSKRFKPSANPTVSPTKKSPKKPTEMSKAQKKVSKQDDERGEDQIEVRDQENDIYVVTSEDPDIRDIECREEDWVFQKREKAKLISCPVPLHVSFHNYVSSREKLREAILRYEPVNIDDIHKGLVANGVRYDPKDLLKFMDKKCITVKTADNNGRNKKHY